MAIQGTIGNCLLPLPRTPALRVRMKVFPPLAKMMPQASGSGAELTVVAASGGMQSGLKEPQNGPVVVPFFHYIYILQID